MTWPGRHCPICKDWFDCEMSDLHGYQALPADIERHYWWHRLERLKNEIDHDQEG